MTTPESKWIKVAAVSEVPQGEAKAVRLEAGRSIALFNVDGKIYATDNQCPHMGYPLTRGVVRHGILTCDWHERSFDLEGGGCFNVECDDLQTFPAETRNGEIWVEIGDFAYKRKDEHLRLLWEGLLSADRWTMSKAIALLLKGGVPEEEVVELILRHIGRHIASSHGSEGGHDVARLINGLKVGRRYKDADRLIAITTAACSAAGGAAERLEVVPLPHPVSWENIERWVRMFSHDGHAGRIERCLFTTRQMGEEDKILPLLFECTAEPHFLGFADNLISLGYLSETVDEFGWEKASELVFNLGAKLVGRGRGEPERFRRDAVRIMRSMQPAIDDALSNASTREVTDYDEDAFVDALTSVDIQRAFDAVRNVLETGVKIERLITTLVLLAADRMARTPVNVDAGWPCLTTELHLAASLRTAQRIGGDKVTAKGIFHAAWLLFADRWLNIPSRPLTEPLSQTELDIPDEDAGVRLIINSIETLKVQEIGGQVLAYLNAGYSGQRLLEEMGRAILWNDTGSQILPTLRTVFEEWENCAEHPAHYQLLVGLARYATDIRTNKDSQSATTTAMRFAEGKTTVEVFED
ncbi:MAG: Rieske (2Fe-2S) protein [Candidatus Poribacteria bacterium]